MCVCVCERESVCVCVCERHSYGEIGVENCEMSLLSKLFF